jgi:DNA adenine methylase
MKSRIKPILRWPGGKRTKINLFAKFFSSNFLEKTFIESCVGSGAFLFAYLPQKAIINDINEALMNVYEVVRDKPSELILELQNHAKQDTEEHFYEVRDLFNTHRNDVGQSIQIAAYLLFLNCRCFNGLYRVNKKGEFNVGYYHGSRQPTRFNGLIDMIPKMSAYLKTIDIRCGSYDLIPPDLPNAFYLLDPPYDEGFSQYDTYVWGDDQFQLLANYVDAIDAAENQFLLCNLDTPLIRRLFDGYQLQYHMVPRYISCNGKNRKPVREVVITNYKNFHPLFAYSK